MSMLNKPLCRIILFIIGFIIMDKTCFMIFVRPYPYDSKAVYDEKKEEYETVFIGASKIMCGIEPKTVEEAWTEAGKVYNAGTASQKIDATYYYLQDLIKHNKIKYVVLGLTYRAYHKDYDFYDIPDDMLVYDRIRSVSIRNEFEKEIVSFPLERLLIHLNSYRYGYTRTLSWLGRLNNILSWVFNKQLGQSEGSRFEYGDRGFVIDSSINQEKTKAEPWGITEINEVGIEWLQRIVKLCNDANIELILVVPPSKKSYIQLVDSEYDYNEINNFFKEFADKNFLKYFNFNLYKERETVFDDSCFASYSHLNYKGAVQFSNIVGMIISESEMGNDVSGLFNDLYVQAD